MPRGQDEVGGGDGESWADSLRRLRTGTALGSGRMKNEADGFSKWIRGERE